MRSSCVWCAHESNGPSKPEAEFEPNPVFTESQSSPSTLSRLRDGLWRKSEVDICPVSVEPAPCEACLVSTRTGSVYISAELTHAGARAMTDQQTGIEWLGGLASMPAY